MGHTPPALRRRSSRWHEKNGVVGCVWCDVSRARLSTFPDHPTRSVARRAKRQEQRPTAPRAGAAIAIPGWYHGRMAMTLRLTPDDEHALALLAEADGVSKQEATVRAIHEAASRRLRQDKIRTISADARERYADLLDRLGK